MPRISVVALIGSGVRGARAAGGLARGSAAALRTKKPRWRRASTRPWASSWSYAATTVLGLTAWRAAHSRTDGRRAPGASRRWRMRSAKRAASWSVSVVSASRLSAPLDGGTAVSNMVWTSGCAAPWTNTVDSVWA